MTKNFGLLLKTTRKAAGFTQDSASNALNGVSSRSIQAYESNETPTPDDAIIQMMHLYNAPELGYEWLRCTKTGRELLPELEQRSLSEGILSLAVNIRQSSDQLHELMAIGADGKIDKKETPKFTHILSALRRTIKDVLLLRFYKNSNEPLAQFRAKKFTKSL